MYVDIKLIIGVWCLLNFDSNSICWVLLFWFNLVIVIYIDIFVWVFI